MIKITDNLDQNEIAKLISNIESKVYNAKIKNDKGRYKDNPDLLVILNNEVVHDYAYIIYKYDKFISCQSCKNFGTYHTEADIQKLPQDICKKCLVSIPGYIELIEEIIVLSRLNHYFKDKTVKETVEQVQEIIDKNIKYKKNGGIPGMSNK